MNKYITNLGKGFITGMDSISTLVEGCYRGYQSYGTKGNFDDMISTTPGFWAAADTFKEEIPIEQILPFYAGFVSGYCINLQLSFLPAITLALVNTCFSTLRLALRDRDNKLEEVLQE